MLDKFQKLFGPNKTTTDVGDIGLSYSSDAIDQKNKAARVASLRRRIFGSIAFVLILCAVLPWVFEPAEDYSNRGAQTDIPEAPKASYSQRMPVVVKKAPKEEASARAEEVARNLSQANPVAATSQIKEAKPEAKKESVKAEAKKAAAPKVSTTTPKASEKAKVEAKKVQAAPAKTSQVAKTKEGAKATQAAKANGNLYYIQIVATSNRTSAVEKANRIRKLGLPVYIEKTQRHQADIWRVRVGRFDTLKKANVALDKLALNSVTNGGIMTEKPTKK